MNTEFFYQTQVSIASIFRWIGEIGNIFPSPSKDGGN